MRFSLRTLFAVAAFGAFATTSCSEKQADNAASTASDSIENTADSVSADMAREPGDTAVVRDQPADNVVEKVPATQQ